MPIYNNRDKVLVEFGQGDILISSGLFKSENKGVLLLEQTKVNTIGEYHELDNKEVDIDEYPISLVFSKLESLDVLIERLQTTRKYMTGELNVDFN